MKKFLCSLFVASAFLRAQSQSPTVEVDSNYNSWGWKAIVVRNEFIKFSTVPSIGGRVMEYTLGSLPSLYINPAEFGKTFTPAQNGVWYNFGGFKTWPAPQSKWNSGGWPPPPTLDYGNYSWQIDTTSSPGEAVHLSVTSQTETWYAPGVRFKRTASAYPGTSHIRMDETMFNEGGSPVTWSLWGVSQCIVNHPGLTDYQHFWVFFPINPASRYGPTGVSPQGASKAWKGEVAPGIYGVQFSPDNQKIFADPAVGWIAYANLSDTVIFAKTFAVFEGAEYPDSGARVSVYVSGNVAPIYLEMEIKGPMVQLSSGGDSSLFTENWWAAKMRAPVLGVDSVGAIAQRLTYDPGTRELTGIFGLFYKGSVRRATVDRNGTVVSEGQPIEVSPLAELNLSDTLTVPEKAVAFQLRVYDENGTFVGILDSAGLSPSTSVASNSSSLRPASYSLAPPYPNPFNGGTVLTFNLSETTRGSLKVYDLLGRIVSTLADGNLTQGAHRVVWNPVGVASGMYFARLEIRGGALQQKLVYLR